jgi:hypothetical protein
MPGKLYPDDLARRIKDTGGGKYRPSNGTEGDIFQERWCELCTKDEAARRGDYENGCPIIAAALAWDVDDPDYPGEWVYDGEGQPSCTAFEALKGGPDGG